MIDSFLELLCAHIGLNVFCYIILVDSFLSRLESLAIVSRFLPLQEESHSVCHKFGHLLAFRKLIGCVVVVNQK